MKKNNSTLKPIARELGVTKSDGESDSVFHARVIYTAIGYWLRFLSSNKQASEIGISKASLYINGSSILDGLVNLDENTRSWFFPDEESRPISKIRTTLMRSGDIIEIGYKSDVICSNSSLIHYKDHIITGYSMINETDYSSGLALIKKQPHDNSDPTELFSLFGIDVKDNEEYISYFLQNGNWEDAHNLDSFEVFNPEVNGVLSSCWNRDIPIYEHQLYMVRQKLSFGAYEYMLFKQQFGKKYICRIGDYFQDERIRITQRLLYVMKAYYGKPATAIVNTNSVYSCWHFWSTLPPAEDSILRYIGWPIGNINNPKNEFLVRNEFNDVVSELAKNLGVQIKESDYE